MAPYFTHRQGHDWCCKGQRRQNENVGLFIRKKVRQKDGKDTERVAKGEINRKQGRKCHRELNIG